eukprot:1857248-Alexandrium_andersonii.AAC.1
MRGARTPAAPAHQADPIRSCANSHEVHGEASTSAATPATAATRLRGDLPYRRFVPPHKSLRAPLP